MNVVGQVRGSIQRDLEDSFSSGSLMGTAYHVYDEDDLRAGIVPVAPWVYLLDYGSLYEPKHLPVILIQTEYDQRAFQLGTYKDYLFHLALHVVGGNAGQRDDLISGIMENVDEFPLYTWSSGSALESQTTLRLEPDSLGRRWHNLAPAIPPQLVQEGTLRYWTPIVTQMWAINPQAAT